MASPTLSFHILQTIFDPPSHTLQSVHPACTRMSCIATSPNSEKPICRAVVVSERTTPVKAILDFMNRIRQAN